MTPPAGREATAALRRSGWAALRHPGVRGKLFLASLLLIAITALPTWIYLELILQDGEGATLRARLAMLTWVAIGGGVLAALFMSALATHLLSRPLGDLVSRTRALVGEEPTRGEPLGLLESSLNRLGRELEGAVAGLAAERNRLEAVLEGLAEAVFGLDAEGSLTLVNSAGLRLLGHPPRAADGSTRSDSTFLIQRAGQRPDGEAEPSGTSPLGQRLGDLLPALAEAAHAQSGVRAVTLPGPAHFLARVTPLRGGTGRVMVLLDVTRLRQLEQIRRDFVANVSHELRTPVSVIRANAETLRDGALADPARARTFLNALLRNAERLSELVADLLNIARIEAGRPEVELTRVAVVDPAVGAFELVEPIALARGTTVDFDLEEGLVVLADAKALGQVITNLLENAVKYTSEGGTVLLAGQRVGDRVRLEVRDDGPGIPAEHRERVFERFYRVDAGRSKETGGTGLGLAIVKHLVGAMGGQVGVGANTPQGSIFWVELPAG